MNPEVITVTRDVLYEQVWATRMMRLVADQGFNKNALAKTCRKSLGFRCLYEASEQSIGTAGTYRPVRHFPPLAGVNEPQPR